MTKILRAIGLTFVWLILTLLSLWAIAALYVDFRIAALRIPVTLAYIVAVAAILLAVKRRVWVTTFLMLWHCSGMVAQSGKRFQQSRLASRRLARAAWTESDGDRVDYNLQLRLHLWRYEYTDCWHDRTVYLSQLQGVDFVFTTWGVPWIGHPDSLALLSKVAQHRILDRGAL